MSSRDSEPRRRDGLGNILDLWLSALDLIQGIVSVTQPLYIKCGQRSILIHGKYSRDGIAIELNVETARGSLY